MDDKRKWFGPKDVDKAKQYIRKEGLFTDGVGHPIFKATLDYVVSSTFPYITSKDAFSHFSPDEVIDAQPADMVNGQVLGFEEFNECMSEYRNMPTLFQGALRMKLWTRIQ